MGGGDTAVDEEHVRQRLERPLRFESVVSSSLRHLSVAAALVAAAVCALAAPGARSATICGEGMYSYAGYTGGTLTNGVSARITQAGPLSVHNGHVAGWIGVVEPTAARGWLQVGLSAFPGQTRSEIYYEVARPGYKPVYHKVAAPVSADVAHRFAVLEQARRPGWWVVWVDGRPVSSPVYLAGSHDRWTAQVLGESWAGKVSGTCNAYAYAFSGVTLHPAGKPVPERLAGRLYHDPDYIVTDRTRSGFVAASFRPADVRGAAVEPSSPSAAENATGAASQPPQSTHVR